MDTFDLRWPATSATFCTNGWRCRIVWRGKQGNLGGTIENNDLCKRRVADSLAGAPELLDQLRAAGYVELAAEIQTLAPASTSQPQAVPELPVGAMIDNWLGALSGPAQWQTCGNRRASNWLSVASLEVGAGAGRRCEEVSLKTPTAKGSRDWVLKCVWPAAPKGHEHARPRFYSAQSFHGICACLTTQDDYRSVAFVDALLGGTATLADEYAEVAEAAAAWAIQKASLQGPDAVH